MTDDELRQATFDACGRVHEWRRYVPQEYRERWTTLTHETRRAIFIMAEEQADKEDWERIE